MYPTQRYSVPTGISLNIPPGFEGQIRPRSGLALLHGVTILNSPATIDSGYRDQIRVQLINMGEQIFEISDNMRIAQLVFSRVQKIKWQEVVGSVMSLETIEPESESNSDLDEVVVV